MKIIFSFLILSLTVCIGLRAQQSPLLTLFPVEKSSFNPAYAVEDKVARLALFHRSQWLGYEDQENAFGAPSTQFVSLNVPYEFSVGGTLGASVFKDDLGPISTYDIRTLISAGKSIRNFDISVGIQPSLKLRGLRSDLLNPVNLADPTLQGLLDSLDNANTSAFDLNAGFSITHRKFTVGGSVSNLLTSNLNFLSSEGQLFREYNLYGEYIFDLSYQLMLNPFLLLRSDLSSITYDLGVMANYQSDYMVGISWRKEESVSFMVNIKDIMEKKFSLGFAYDFVIYNNTDKRFSSLEFFGAYQFGDLSFGKKKIIRTPRFSY